jgi:hypothetical protein
MQEPPDPQKENPESVAAEIGVEGIEALPKRVERYGTAKSGALDIAEYMGTVPDLQRMAENVAACGDYLVFRHYYTVDKVRLHGARLCRKHLLCPLCAVRRGAKALQAYLSRFEVIREKSPELLPYLVTLTVKDGPDLAERFKHLRDSQHELWKQKHRGRGSVLDGVAGAVWSYEIKRGSGSDQWHPHLHMIALSATGGPDQVELSRAWHSITGDSFVVDVRPIDRQDPAGGFLEVFKYAVKFSEQDPADTVHAWRLLAGKRLLGSAGAFRGVEVPEDLLDDPEGFQTLPYVTLFYRFLRGAGYSLNQSRDVPGLPLAA